MATEEELRIEAVKIAKAKVGFYIHLSAYILVNAMLIILWWWTNDIAGVTIFFWPIFTLVGWGIGLAAHGIGAFAGLERQTERELQKLRGQQPPK
jgi:hypothetical protein